MSRFWRNSALILSAVFLMFSVMACGGGSSSDDVAYGGETEPAVADSTTAATLTEYAMGVMEAGFPLAQPFVEPPPMMPGSLSAQPLAWAATTTVTIPTPDDAVIAGTDYSLDGTGTAKLNGTLTLYLGADSDEAETWNIIDGALEGDIFFDDFSTDGGPAVSGKVTVPYAFFYFTGSGQFNITDMEFTGDPGMPDWRNVEMTFTKITVSDDGDSWYLGEGDWELEIEPGMSADLDIYSLAVEGEGSTYKLEDTNVTVTFDTLLTPTIEFEPATDRTTINIAGTEGADNGAFYHPELGLIYFSGELTEEDPPDDLTGGSLYFYDAASEGTNLFTVHFEYDEMEGATAYFIFVDAEDYFEFGYIIDGVFTPDPDAEINFPI